MRELEETFGAQLFIRNGPRVNLTAEGHALVDHARRLLDDASSVVARFRGRDPLRGQLRIGVNERFALICLHDLLQRLEVEYPESAHLDPCRRHWRGQSPVNDREARRRHCLATGYRAACAGPGRLASIVSVGSPAHDYAVTQGADATGARRFHLTISPTTARLHGTAMTWFAQADITPLRVSTCNSLPVTISMILRGLAIGLVPTMLMQEHVRRREARFVKVSPAMGGHRVMLCNQASEFGPKLKQILDLIRTILVERGLFA